MVFSKKKEKKSGLEIDHLWTNHTTKYSIRCTLGGLVEACCSQHRACEVHSLTVSLVHVFYGSMTSARLWKAHPTLAHRAQCYKDILN